MQRPAEKRSLQICQTQSCTTSNEIIMTDILTKQGELKVRAAPRARSRPLRRAAARPPASPTHGLDPRRRRPAQVEHDKDFALVKDLVKHKGAQRTLLESLAKEVERLKKKQGERATLKAVRPPSARAP